MQRVRDLRILSPEWGVLIIHLISAGEGQEDFKGRVICDFKATAFLDSRAGAHPDSQTVTTCTRHTQALARQNPRRRSSGQSPSSPKKVFTNNSCWEKSGLFSSMEWSWAYQPYSRRTCQHKSWFSAFFSLMFCCCFKRKKNMKLVGIWEELRECNNMIKIKICYVKSSKTKIKTSKTYNNLNLCKNP